MCVRVRTDETCTDWITARIPASYLHLTHLLPSFIHSFSYINRASRNPIGLFHLGNPFRADSLPFVAPSGTGTLAVGTRFRSSIDLGTFQTGSLARLVTCTLTYIDKSVYSEHSTEGSVGCKATRSELEPAAQGQLQLN